MSNPRIAVLASGEGTTAEAVAKAWSKMPDAPRIELIISDKPDAGIFKRLSDVEAAVLDDEQAILDKLEAGNYELIWLAGYMKKIGPKIVERFGWRDDYKNPYQAMMLNTHPGLLPATVGHHGIHVQEYVLENKLPAGHSLHVVSENYDEGPLVAEHEVEVMPDDTADSLMERVKGSEKKFLPDDIENFIKERQQWLKS